MNPEPLVYKPRYSVRLRALTWLVPALFFAMLCLIPLTLINVPAGLWSLVLLLGVLTSLIPFLIIREVRFLGDMVVRRHFLPDLIFSLDEIEQIGPKTIRAGGRTVRLGELANLAELEESFRKWKAAKLLKEARAGGKPYADYFPQRGYGVYASFWGLMTGVILMMMEPSWLRIEPRWILAGGFLLVYILYIYVVPRYL